MRRQLIWLILIAASVGLFFRWKPPPPNLTKLDWEATKLRWSDYRHGSPAFIFEFAAGRHGVQYTFDRGEAHHIGSVPVVTYQDWMQRLEEELPKALEEMNKGNLRAELVVSTAAKTIRLRIGEQTGESSSSIEKMMDESFPGMEISSFMAESK